MSTEWLDDIKPSMLRDVPKAEALRTYPFFHVLDHQDRQGVIAPANVEATPTRKWNLPRWRNITMAGLMKIEDIPTTPRPNPELPPMIKHLQW